jgi:hypothetical protein
MPNSDPGFIVLQTVLLLAVLLLGGVMFGIILLRDAVTLRRRLRQEQSRPKGIRVCMCHEMERLNPNWRDDFRRGERKRVLGALFRLLAGKS